MYFRFDDAVLFIQLYMKLNQDLKIEANDPNKLKLIEVIFFAVTFVLFIVNFDCYIIIFIIFISEFY